MPKLKWLNSTCNEAIVATGNKRDTLDIPIRLKEIGSCSDYFTGLEVKQHQASICFFASQGKNKQPTIFVRKGHVNNLDDSLEIDLREEQLGTDTPDEDCCFDSGVGCHECVAVFAHLYGAHFFQGPALLEQKLFLFVCSISDHDGLS